MLTVEQLELNNIEALVYDKFKKMDGELFLFDGDIMGYDEMITLLAQTVQQHCWDDEIEWSDLELIEESQWDEWLAEYEIPEESCTCSRGCKYCLGTEW